MSTRPFKCPVCEGNGKRPGDFYLRAEDQTIGIAPIELVDCQSCEKGIVWGKEEEICSIHGLPISECAELNELPLDPISTWPYRPTLIDPFSLPSDTISITYPTADKVCTCPPEVKRGEPYIGDVICPVHNILITCISGG